MLDWNHEPPGVWPLQGMGMVRSTTRAPLALLIVAMPDEHAENAPCSVCSLAPGASENIARSKVAGSVGAP